MTLPLQQFAAMSFSEDIRFRDYGFAARCEAVAWPRRYSRQMLTGSAPGVAFGPERFSNTRNRGIARLDLALVGGAEPPAHISRQSRDTTSKLVRQTGLNTSGKIGGVVIKLALALFSVLLISIPGFAQQEKKSSCIACHLQLEDPRLSAPAKLFDNDIHRSRGLSCNDCHGGDPNADTKEAAKDRSKGYLGRPRTLDIPAYCGKCHSDANLMKRFNPSLRVDQEREYYTSIHGARLKEGDQRAATCISCHSVHGIRAVNDPLSSVYPLNVADTCAKCHASADYMHGFNIPSDQFAKFKTSVHAKALYEKQDLSAPTCNDCHGNHGAAPPGIAAVANVCGQCHARQAELFQKSPHKAAFDQKELGECITCHSNHAIATPNDQMLGTGQGSLCINCHAPSDKGFVAAGQMRSMIDELITRTNASSEVLARAERLGMEVSRPKFELKGATDALTHARVLIHSASADEVKKVVAPGLEVAEKGYQSGLAALAERTYRRKGLLVSLVFILFLAVVVYLKIRQIEGKARTA